MSHRDFARFAMTLLVLASPVLSQRGGRQPPPPEVAERWGNYFTTVSLQDLDKSAADVDFAQTEHVKSAAKDGQLSVLYIYDSTGDPKKISAFERTLFNHNKVNPGLRLFRCSRIDLAQNLAQRKKIGKLAPLFVVFDEKGKKVGEASMPAIKPVPNSLIRLLTSATKGYAKTSFENFVKVYGKFVRDTNNLIVRKRTLAGKLARFGDRSDVAARKSIAAIEKDQADLQKATDAHYASEKQILELAKVPPRDSKAVLVGGLGGGRGR